MNQDELAKAITQSAELEYLFDNDEWLPASFKMYLTNNFGSSTTVIQLLHHPRSHSGVIHLNADDSKDRLRVKGSNYN